MISKTVLTHSYFLAPETFLCLFLLLSWLLFWKKPLPSFFLISIPIFFFPPYVCQVFTLLERVTTLTSVSQLAANSHTFLSLNPYSRKNPSAFKLNASLPHIVVAVLCLAQPKLPETQHPVPQSLPLKKWFFQQADRCSGTSRSIRLLMGIKWGWDVRAH